MILNQKSHIDKLVFNSVFSDDLKIKYTSEQEIRSLAAVQKIYLASIHNLYMQIGKGMDVSFTVPAINIRTLTYDTACLVFSLMREKKIGPVIFEIARSEIIYTEQSPREYATVILAAAIKENYKGPVFVQGDHYQFKRSLFFEDPQKETKAIQTLIAESIDAGFYNIDIDASTLVDIDEDDLEEKQKINAEVTAKITEYIRSIQPHGITVSVGGEIGHIGGKNSTVEDFHSFMSQYRKYIPNTYQGISKVSVQTGTSHGGVPKADGTIAPVDIDFDVLKKISDVAKTTYGIGGAVQHGASTLPDDLFDRFPQVGTLEIHLATGFQNIVFDNLPAGLKEEIYTWIEKERKDDWKENQTKEQFLYKTRKRAFGPFKKQLWTLSQKEKDPIHKVLKEKLDQLFELLQMRNTAHYIENYVPKSNNTH